MSERRGCRSCGGAGLSPVLDFGETPLADVLLAADELDREDARFPLRLVFCRDCALVQITEDVPLELLYGGDYPYYTSVSPELVDHFGAGVRSILQRHPMEPGPLVIEAASNDGCQLAAFREAGLAVLGVDPASGPARAANEAGIETLVRFFDPELARELQADGREAALVTGNNVLNLMQDPGEFLTAAELVLAPGGVVCVEVPYFVDTVALCAFDNVYHQNATYWTVTALERLCSARGFRLLSVERIPTFGGSLRVYASRTGDPDASVAELVAEERRRGVDRPGFYERFAGRVEGVRSELLGLLDGIRAEGERVVAYGAAGGMATTLLTYLGLDSDRLEYAVDINPHKHGRYTAGSRLLIHPVERLVEDVPDYALLLAWNFADAILAGQGEYRGRGGKFIVPIPEPRVV